MKVNNANKSSQLKNDVSPIKEIKVKLGYIPSEEASKYIISAKRVKKKFF